MKRTNTSGQESLLKFFKVQTDVSASTGSNVLDTSVIMVAGSDVHSTSTSVNGSQSQPICVIQGKLRGSYKPEYSKTFKWLQSNGLCSVCSTFYKHKPSSMSDGTFVTQPFYNWHKATGKDAKNNKLLKHQESQCHRNATLFFNKCGLSTSVYTQLHKVADAQNHENVARFADFIKIVYWLLKGEVAHFTNFNRLVDLCSEMDRSDTLRQWIDTRSKNAHYRSNEVIGEYVDSIGLFLLNKLVTQIKQSHVHMLSIMADEATDVANRTEISLCVRYINFDTFKSPEVIESFITIKNIATTDAETIKSTLLEILQKELDINLDNIVWQSFDGANNMSGRQEGVQAKLSKYCKNAVYIHCRSHCLQLALVYATENQKEIKRLFSTLNSIWRLFSTSSKKLAVFRQIQIIMGENVQTLVHAVPTRWSSYANAVNAIVEVYSNLVISLQEIHSNWGELSSEAGGILLTLQDKSTIHLIYAVKFLLEPISILSKQLQRANTTIVCIPELVDVCMFSLERVKNEMEYQKDATLFISNCSFALMGECDVEKLHRMVVLPFIDNFVRQMNNRFNKKTMDFCSAFKLLDPALQHNAHMSTTLIDSLCRGHPLLSEKQDAMKLEYRMLQNALQVAKDKPHGSLSAIMMKLADPNDIMHDTFPNFAVASQLAMVCPIGTASVERSFSAMNRIATRLRNRLIPTNLATCMRVSLEGPETLDTQSAMAIARQWHSRDPKTKRKLNII